MNSQDLQQIDQLFRKRLKEELKNLPTKVELKTELKNLQNSLEDFISAAFSSTMCPLL